MNLEQLKLWQDEFERRREAELRQLRERAMFTIAEFVARFRSHELHGRTWRPIRFWDRRGHRQWVEFQISKRAMEKLLA